MFKNNFSVFRCLSKKIVCIIFLINTPILLAQLPGKLTAKATTKALRFSIKFSGLQIALYSYAGTENGYAKMVLSHKKGKVIVTSLIDMYSKSPQSTPVFRSPIKKKTTIT